MGWKNLFGKREPVELKPAGAIPYLNALRKQNSERARKINRLESELLNYARAKEKIKQLEIKLKYSENAQHINKIAELQEENALLGKEIRGICEGYNFLLTELYKQLEEQDTKGIISVVAEPKTEKPKKEMLGKKEERPPVSDLEKMIEEL